MRWRRIPFSPSYLVSEIGDVKRGRLASTLRPCRLKRGGYLAVSLWEGGKGRTWPVHQIVTIVFHRERPPKMDAAHIDGDKANNHWRNLRWATRAENEADKILHSRDNSGDRNGMSKAAQARRAAL